MTEMPRAHDDPIPMEPEEVATQAVPDVNILGAKDILTARAPEMELVDVPEWGGAVFVKAMTGTERDAYEASCMQEVKGKGKGGKMEMKPLYDNIRARLCVRCMCNAQGARLFTDEQAVPLGRTSAKALDRVFTLAQKLNGVTEEDIDELAKNSERTDSDGSSLS